MKTLWGIDLGGTKIEAVVLKPGSTPEVINRQRIPTEAGKGYEHIIGQIKKLVDKVSADTGLKPEKLGVGTPGALDPHGQTIKNSNTVCLIGKPFRNDLEAALGIPAIFANDANCFALAEYQMGIVQDVMPNAEVVFGIIMGTGVGGGIVAHGKIIHGRHGIGGEWGHMLLDASGGKCYCGQTGCTETILAGPHLERYYRSIGGEEGIRLPEIYRRHLDNSDVKATETMQRMVHFFGVGVAQIINVLDPDVIMIGGGVGNIDLLYTEGVEEVKKYIFNHRLDTLFVRPKLGDSAGVFGAAILTA